MSRVLLVDDEPGVLRALRRVLSLVPCRFDGIDFQLQVDMAESPERALELVHSRAYDLVLSDYRMPGMDGVALLKAVREIQPDAARMILSGYADLNGVLAAINEAQIVRFLCKPWSDYELVAAMGQALAYRAVLLDNRRMADLLRLQSHKLTPQDYERRRLEEAEPGITQVRWAEDGSVLLDEDLARQLEDRP
ncbi:Response regulator receiver domain-containing protein [Rubrivivax sp. A210]|uniref:response regulator n=1 Tax=Rubrivivax sp. A210 TaxID=2772301 RepID=UPI00191863B9|nr:response regulator [Rubrivivax sp. A210]CAD5374362.1 Response regulator receiver domain-containing protein [Rubrivivax sp. A210]